MTDSQSEAGTQTAQAPYEFDFGVLLPFVDVLYGATLGYVFLRIAERLQRFFHPFGYGAHPADDVHAFVNPLAQLFLEILILNYLIHDFAEARLLTTKYPYRGHKRFVIDIAIAALFLLAFVGAEEASAMLFAPFAAVFLLGAIWALMLEAEWGKQALFPYAQTTVLTHLAAMVACLAFLGYRWRLDSWYLNARSAGALWAAYGVWVILVLLSKFRLGLARTDVDLLPVGVIGSAFIKLWRSCIDAKTRLSRWFRR